MLTACGWIRVRRAYSPPKTCNGSETSFALDTAIGLAHGATPAARDCAVRCAALCGSFAEGRDMLSRLTAVKIATSTLRTMALRAGEQLLARQEDPPKDIRPVEPSTTSRSKQTFPTQRTMYIMMDGTGVPCTKADTEGICGRSPDAIAGKREIKVGVIGHYSLLDLQDRPVPETSSVTHVVSDQCASDFGTIMRKAANSRGYGAVPRAQVVGDGADWIANIARQAFPDAIFTVDYYHACEHLHALCLELHLSEQDTRRTYRKFRGLLFRNGAASLIKNFTKLHQNTIDASADAAKELKYFTKRQDAMCYGHLRKDGLYIGSGHVEAACRTTVARRCKQAGMHWRFHNATRICAILAALRSSSFAV